MIITYGVIRLMTNKDPYFKIHVFCCVNQRPAVSPKGCCADKGAQALRNYMKVRAKELGVEGIRVNNSGCLDRCDAGPVMVIYPEGVWYSYGSEEDIDEILQVHLLEGRVVERLLV